MSLQIFLPLNTRRWSCEWNYITSISPNLFTYMYVLSDLLDGYALGLFRRFFFSCNKRWQTQKYIYSATSSQFEVLTMNWTLGKITLLSLGIIVHSSLFWEVTGVEPNIQWTREGSYTRIRFYYYYVLCHALFDKMEFKQNLLL